MAVRHIRGWAVVGTAVLGLAAAGTGMSQAADGRAVAVSTAAELTAALADARAGDVITLAAGTYAGGFFGTASGTEAAPITLTGPKDAVLSNPGRTCAPKLPGRDAGFCGYGFHLGGADFWRLEGFSVRDGAKGIVLDQSSDNVIDGVDVGEVDDEGIHFRTSSADNLLTNSRVHDTGLRQAGFGEGVYLGSAVSNWDNFGTDGGAGPDRSDRNQVVGNTIGPNVTAELMDIKEGTVDGVVRGNTFVGEGITGEHFADSWVDAKGDGYLFEDNTGTAEGEGVLKSGYETHTQTAGTGCGNVFRDNDSDLGGKGGFAFNVTNNAKCAGEPNVVSSTNTVAGASKGLTNIQPSD